VTEDRTEDVFLQSLMTPELREAMDSRYGDRQGPHVPLDVLLRGSLMGFTPEWAELVLLDTDGGSLDYLNGLFASYFEGTGRVLPFGIAKRVEEERQDGTPKWNTVIVVEAWGWGLPDDIWDEQAEKELSGYRETHLQGMDFHPGETRELVGVLSLGSKPRPAAQEPWEKYFRTAHLLILVRHTDKGLVVAIQSKDETGPRELIFDYTDGSQTTHQIQVKAKETWRLPGYIESPDGQLPVTGCIRSVRS